MFKTIAPGIQS